MPKHKYNPDYRVPPGRTLIECLPLANVKMSEMPARLRMSATRFLALLDGDYPLNENIASTLAELTGVPKGFWNRLEAHYRQPGGEQK